ncbi:PP2C-domain-containing protein [Pseudovirgaria hyperparasitica]|uniref:Adenylate cyclase n=1 Tax=Pseudovirgaria hyperparasitica TaxID=470096 RepID=A0A6A6VVI0_9PEZI|nr:PP2C-domain-containing protein [Pseudovirgaria hyperparasitica]KAF2753630.1 PP2C-domain-containing protein [Pseudovirgaria hyperparasitica]
MTRKENVGRHGSTESSGADSWRSSDTIRGSPAGRARNAPVRSRPGKEKEADIDADISPGTRPRVPAQSSRSKIAPWETSGKTSEFNNYRKELAVLDAPNSNPAPNSRQRVHNANSDFPPWATGLGGTPNVSSVFGSIGSFYNDSNEDLTQLSPGLRPGSSKDEVVYPGDDRRPSIASNTTVSSQGSKSSIGRGFHKKLQGFFGEEFPVIDSRQSSDTSLAYNAFAAAGAGNNSDNSSRVRPRNNSMRTAVGEGLNSRPVSPASSRPRTPLPSSEVTPWEYQDLKELPGSISLSRPSTEHSNSKFSKSHKLHLPGHRQRGSKEDNRAESNIGYTLRPSLSREESSGSARKPDSRLHQLPVALSSAFNSSTTLGRPSSPTPSGSSALSKENMAQRSPGGNGNHKRSLIDRLTRKHKADRVVADPLSDLSPSSTSLHAQLRAPKLPKSEPTGNTRKRPGIEPPPSIRSKESIPKKEHASRIPFKSSKRGHLAVEPSAKDPNEARASAVMNEALWNLDTDLTQMEGIIGNPLLGPLTPPVGDVYTAFPGDDAYKEPKEYEAPPAIWDAPDSWAVKRVGDENMGRLRELDENGDIPKDDNVGPPYCVRIFRVDSTFAVLSVGLNTTVAEIIAILGKKTLLQDELNNYQIVMRKHDTSRQLQPQERPVVIQRHLLEQAGYTDSDRLEDVGREDNSYLCRFTFLPSKMTGYSSLEKDPGFKNMQKFSHIDLQGRNLVTIPITLYQKATEIISLNLSRNLSLDVPKDFIQTCTNLRDIKYTSNEAWRLPPSLGLASRLTMLDVSNNRLEQLDNTELNKLHSLQGLRLSNNKLTSLPSYFGQYKALRSLNLSSNFLKEFPDFLCEVRTLVDLDISFNTISSIPKIGQLTCLERLWATNNKLTGSFPPSLKNLVNLREIDVRFNSLNNIDVMSQLPKLELLIVGHNSISAFEGTFEKVKVLHMNHNPVTRFGITSYVPSLSVLNLASAKLAQLPEDLFQNVPGLIKFILDKNHFASLSPQIGRLTRLEHFSVARNNLEHLPTDIGRLIELRFLDVRENNLRKLPQEIWFARKLETLNVSSNVLDTFPKPLFQALNVNEPAGLDGGSTPTQNNATGPEFEELGKLEDFAARRPSQASGYLSVGSSPGTSVRKGSMASSYASGRKPSIMSRSTEGTLTPVTRKDSSLSNRLMSTFAGSLRHIYLADNRLNDDVFDELALLPELRIVNMSYNLLYDIPPRTIRRWSNLAELYLSGNDLTSLPAEDLEEVTSLKVLHINGNKFQVLPAELGKVAKLAILDAGNNALKYNVSNWPYDWNWNWNHNLKFLNLSGNKRLEIKKALNAVGNAREGRDLTDFSSLTNLRVLGLMDVTMIGSSVPEQFEDRRVRTSGSTVGSMAYGMADSLGRNEHLSTMDLVVERFRSHDDETLLGLFDGQALSGGGSKIARYLYENFKLRFTDELERLRPQESPADALRRTYLGLNKDLATAATSSYENKAHTSQAPGAHRGSISLPELGEDDLNSGSVATVLFLKEMDLFVSNVGDAQALLIQSDYTHRTITRKHDPAEHGERARIREAGGFVSRQGKLNDVLEVSRAFGYVQMSPSVIAAPHVNKITLKETDEMIVVASRELWEYLAADFVVDVARSERNDLMRAAQKLRDLAIAFGAANKITVMIIGVNDLRSKQRAKHRTHSMSMGPSGSPDEFTSRLKNAKRAKDIVADSKLARLDQEVDAPIGEVSLVFTDIKSSTLLWETYPVPMRSAIRMHNEVMRRHLRIIGGYEVKTEGDAFMVAFPTVTSALLWCFTIQSQLLEVPWPQEILNSVNGQEVLDADGNVIFRGLSVRMGIHWGTPVCEVDPVTKRMDYFGPMVNRASRISSVADGGQITVSSDFIAEIQRLLETHIETDRSGSTGSEDTMTEDPINQVIRRELRSLSSQGFEVKDLGERRLKGLENPEYIYLMYPHSLASRLSVQQQRNEAEQQVPQQQGIAATKVRDSTLTIDTEHVWDLWNVSLRLEMLCSALESSSGPAQLKAPETALLEKMKNRGGEITDRFLINFVEHQISRIESCVTTLALRNLIRPFGQNSLLDQACPMADIFAALTSQLDELKTLQASAVNF